MATTNPHLTPQPITLNLELFQFGLACRGEQWDRLWKIEGEEEEGGRERGREDAIRRALKERKIRGGGKGGRRGVMWVKGSKRLLERAF